jgi:hypothetical protein
MAAPQLVVIGSALVFSSLRMQVATTALVSLSILLLVFCWITSLDANGAMLWMFYYPASAIIALVAWLFITLGVNRAPPNKFERSRGIIFASDEWNK